MEPPFRGLVQILGLVTKLLCMWKHQRSSDHSSLTIPGFWSSVSWYHGCYPYPIHRHVKGKLSSSTLCDSGSPDGENKQQDCMLNIKHSSEVYKKTRSYLIPVKQENSTSTSLGSELYIIDCPKIMFCVPA